MKKMKHSVKGIIVVMVMVMALCMTSITAQAKSNKLTLYVGEQAGYSYIGIGKIKKVKSSKSKIVSAKKYKNGTLLEAKTPGKAKVTVNGSRGTWIHNVTVKKADFVVTPTYISNEKLLLTLSNNTSGYFDSFDVSVIFKDTAGNTLSTRMPDFYKITPKSVAVSSVSVPRSYDNLDLSKTEIVINKWSRSLSSKYKKYNKVSFSETLNGKNLVVDAKTSYKGKGTIYIGYDVSFYDASGQLISVTNGTAMLYKSKKTYSSSFYVPENTATYTVTKRIYEKSY